MKEVLWLLTTSEGRFLTSSWHTVKAEKDADDLIWITLGGVFIELNDKNEVVNTFEELAEVTEMHLVIINHNEELVQCYERGLAEFRFQQLLDSGSAFAENLFERVFPDEVKKLVRESPIFAKRLEKHLAGKLNDLVNVWKGDK